MPFEDSRQKHQYSNIPEYEGYDPRLAIPNPNPIGPAPNAIPPSSPFMQDVNRVGQGINKAATRFSWNTTEPLARWAGNAYHYFTGQTSGAIKGYQNVLNDLYRRGYGNPPAPVTSGVPNVSVLPQPQQSGGKPKANPNAVPGRGATGIPAMSPQQYWAQMAKQAMDPNAIPVMGGNNGGALPVFPGGGASLPPYTPGQMPVASYTETSSKNPGYGMNRQPFVAPQNASFGELLAGGLRNKSILQAARADYLESAANRKTVSKGGTPYVPPHSAEAMRQAGEADINLANARIQSLIGTLNPAATNIFAKFMEALGGYYNANPNGMGVGSLGLGNQ